MDVYACTAEIAMGVCDRRDILQILAEQVTAVYTPTSLLIIYVTFLRNAWKLLKSVRSTDADMYGPGAICCGQGSATIKRDFVMAILTNRITPQVRDAC